jgi:predicted secreted Zn-dependent protease
MMLAVLGAVTCLSPALAQTKPAQTKPADAAPAQVSWSPTEEVKTYPITGKSGIELYSSIGEHGPEIGRHVRAIAHTDFKLTWTRRYDPQPDGACVISVNRPKLVIIYTLPRPAKALSPELDGKWKPFIAGVRLHEAQHGEMIVAMVKAIEAYSVGLRVESDPKCSKIRTVLTARLGELSRAQQQQSRDFDKVELSPGGNVHQLILKLVNER